MEEVEVGGEEDLPIVEIRAKRKYTKTTPGTDDVTTDFYRTRMMFQNVADQWAQKIYGNGRMTNSGILGEA